MLDCFPVERWRAVVGQHLVQYSRLDRPRGELPGGLEVSGAQVSIQVRVGEQGVSASPERAESSMPFLVQ